MAIIGFIGLGHMGGPMAANLLKHHHQVLGFDLDSQVMDQFVTAGGTKVSDLAALAKQAEVIITMLPAGQHVKKVCEELFPHAKPNTLFIDCSSIDVESSRFLAKRAHELGFRMIDAPVSGGMAGAAAGTLTFMMGGTPEDVQVAQEVLAHMGKKLVHAGPAGNGQVAKICNNMLLGISMIGVSEAFALAEKLGLATDKFFEISSNASGQCWAMTSYCPVPGILPASPANHDYQPGFATAMMLKDLRLSQQAAATVNGVTPLGALATSIYALFAENGQANLDFSAIIKLFEK